VTCLFGNGLFATVCLATVCLTAVDIANAIALHNCDNLRVHTFMLGAVLGFHISYGGERTSTSDEYECDGFVLSQLCPYALSTYSYDSYRTSPSHTYVTTQAVTTKPRRHGDFWLRTSPYTTAERTHNISLDARHRESEFFTITIQNPNLCYVTFVTPSFPLSVL